MNSLDKIESPKQNQIQSDIYWLKNKLWEEGWKGFNSDDQDRTIEMLNLLIDKENEQAR